MLQFDLPLYLKEIKHLYKQRKKLKEHLAVRGAAEETGELIRQKHLFQLKEIPMTTEENELEAGMSDCGGKENEEEDKRMKRIYRMMR